MSKRLSPREKLTKAVFGTLHPTEEQVAAAEERMYDRQAASVTDDDLRRCGAIPLRNMSTDPCFLQDGAIPSCGGSTGTTRSESIS